MSAARAGIGVAPLLSLHAVSVRFGSVQALDRVSIEVRRGEFVALIGANGAGKTTLLRALHGMLALEETHGRPKFPQPQGPQRGPFVALGAEPAPNERLRAREWLAKAFRLASRKAGDARRRPGGAFQGSRVLGDPSATQAMVYQRPFMLRLTAANNLRLALWLAGAVRETWPASCERALRRVGLQGCADRPARALSGGQQQRLALARAWAVQPSVLFLDEPTANLDPTAKKEVETLLTGFSAEGTTLVMSTHNLGQAKRLASRVVYLEEGRVCADLPTVEFFSERLDGRANLFLKGEMVWRPE